MRFYLELVRSYLTRRCSSLENAHLRGVNSAFPAPRALIQRTPNKLYLAVVIAFSCLTPTVLWSAAPKDAKTALKENHDALAPEISLEELRSLIEDKNKKSMAVIDANSESSFKQGHIPGALHFAKIEANFAAALPKDKNALIVAYCGNPMCTAWVAPAEKAKSLGYTNIRHLKAGIKGWRDAKFPTHEG